MKKNEVKIGKVYQAKVTNKIAPVRIDSENQHGGWNGTNMVTKKSVRIKSAQRLRGPHRAGHEYDKSSAAPEPKATEASPTETPTSAPVATTENESAPTAKAAKKRHRTQRGEKTKRPSGLDAAAQILTEANEPLSAGEIVRRMLDQGLWQTKGQTPAATIYAAMLREINTKGDDARFRKVERGKFETTSKKGA